MSSNTKERVIAHGYSSLLKDGIRKGFWNESWVTVNELKILVDKKINEYECNFARGTNVRCLVRIKDGEVTVVSFSYEDHEKGRNINMDEIE